MANLIDAPYNRCQCIFGLGSCQKPFGDQIRKTRAPLQGLSTAGKSTCFLECFPNKTCSIYRPFPSISQLAMLKA